MRSAVLAWVLGCAGAAVLAVRPGDFKKCHDVSFCRRFRRIADHVETTGVASPYSVGTHRVEDAAQDARMRWPVHSALHPDIQFELTMSFFADGNARVQMDEVGERYQGWKRYDETPVWTVVEMPAPATDIAAEYTSDTHTTTVRWGAHGNEMVLEHEPMRVLFVRDGVVQMILNDRALLHMEHFRAKPENFPSDRDADEADPKASLAFQERAQAIAARHGRTSPPSRATIEAWAGFEAEDHGEWEESWSRVP